MTAQTDSRMNAVVALGRVIRQHVEQADLETALQVAAERHRRLRELVADHPARTVGEESLAHWMRDIVREDKGLMDALTALRGQMEMQLGDSRRSLRTARAYATVADTRG